MARPSEGKSLPGRDCVCEVKGMTYWRRAGSSSGGWSKEREREMKELDWQQIGRGPEYQARV